MAGPFTTVGLSAGVVAAFCGSACLFLLELVVGRFFLPRFGGAPAVWTACLAFFQIMLVAGYALSDHLIRRHSILVQLLAQVALFTAAIVAVPTGIAFAESVDPSSFGLPPVFTVAMLLALSAGPPLLALATLAPLHAHWRAASTPAGRRDAAYALYAAGNAGSFALLLSYPFVIESTAGLASQASLTSRLFLAVAALTILNGVATILIHRRLARENHAPSDPARQASPGRFDRNEWIGWLVPAALPASWLAGVTTHATTEIAPIALLWVAPLAIYLGSFVVVFSPWGRGLRRFEPVALTIAVGLGIWMVGCDVTEPAIPAILAHLAVFLVVCVCVHGMLVDRRPASERLSSYYLAIAIGGAVGGLFNAIVAPALFDAHHEFIVVMAAVAALLPSVLPARLAPYRRGIVLGAGGVLVLLVTTAAWLPIPKAASLATMGAAVLGVLVSLDGWRRAATVALLLFALFQLGESARGVVHRSRTFFGVLRVCEHDNGPSRTLMHGGITHGIQLVSDDLERRRIPLSYYAEAGPLGSIFRGLRSAGSIRRVGVAGLGIGTVASYAQPEEEFVFFEIDPEVARIAGTGAWFSFLADCRGDVRVVVDDARLALAREPAGSLDLLVIDAFSGDSVPTHLLTREALARYGRAVGPEGVVAIHVSNKYLDFLPVVERLAADGGWMGLLGRDQDVPPDCSRSTSEWIALSRSLDTIKAIYANPTSELWRWEPLSEKPSGRPWTDDHTSVAEALRQ